MSFQDLVAAAQLNAAANRNALLQRLEQARIETKVLGSPVSRVGQTALMPIVTKPWRPTRPQKEYSPAPDLSLELALAWVHRNVNNNDKTVTITRLSGNGKESIVKTRQFGTPDFSPSFTSSYTAESINLNWTFQSNDNPNLGALTPYPLSYWERIRVLSTADLLLSRSSTFIPEGPNGLSLPCTRNFLIAAEWDYRKYFNKEYLIRIDKGVGGNEQIFLTEEVEGTADEDPDALYASGSRRIRCNFYVGDCAINVVDQAESVITYQTRETYLVTPGAIREIPFPGQLQERIRRLWGEPPANPATLSSSTVAAFPTKSRIDNVINGKTYYEAFVQRGPSSPTPPTFYYREDGDPTVNQPDGREEEDQGKVLALSPMANFGLGQIDAEAATFEGFSPTCSTPLLYKTLLGENTLLWDDFDTGSLQALSACLEALKPFSRSFLWINVLPLFDSSTYLNTGRYELKTYASSASNASPAGTWRDFKLLPNQQYANGLPFVAGKPPKGTLQLASDRFIPPQGTGPVTPLMATPYGDTAYCRTKLLELGFTAEDLNPTPPTP